MNNLNHRILNNLVIGLPPVAEQRRIVAKVDELMRQCDASAAGLAWAEGQRRALTAAALHGAFGWVVAFCHAERVNESRFVTVMTQRL